VRRGSPARRPDRDRAAHALDLSAGTAAACRPRRNAVPTTPRPSRRLLSAAAEPGGIRTAQAYPRAAPSSPRLSATSPGGAHACAWRSSSPDGLAEQLPAEPRASRSRRAGGRSARRRAPGLGKATTSMRTARRLVCG
jgi:hypothetical protein